MTQTFILDTSTSFGRRAERHLIDDKVVWLTTVAPSGAPAPTPVWFSWTGDEILVASQPDTAKLRNIAGNARVTVNTNSTAGGGDFAVLTGTAVIDESGFTADERASYDAKYRADIERLGYTTDSFHADYAVLLRIGPARIRGH